MAKDLKAKEPKKKGRRLKRTVRRTLGSICLISAILVASIPTEGFRQVAAAADTPKYDEEYIEQYVERNASSSVIPTIASEKIYDTGTGFQFAYLKGQAVIVGFDQNTASLSGTLEGGTLTIPKTFDAYLNYTTTDGNYQCVAVSEDNSFLFYDATPVDPDATAGDPAPTPVYLPCYFSDYDIWKDIPDEDLYFYKTSDSKPDPAGAAPTRVGAAGSDKGNKMRIKNAQVRYIGNQYIRGDAAGGYSIAGNTSEANRVFGNISNVSSLVIEADLYGIGNYAFYDSGSLRKISLNNSLQYLGNYAFAGCNNMSEAELDNDMSLIAIGAHAFENCQALQSFVVPHNVQIIGDAAFRGCAGDATGLQSIDLCGGQGTNTSLKKLGRDLFVNCSKLTSVTFPGSLEGEDKDIDISNFEGCLSLQYIAVRARDINITEKQKTSEGGSFGYEEFQKQYNDSTIVNGTFYFEGPTSESIRSTLHQTAMDHYFAFSYLNDNLEKMNIYELTMKTDGGKSATYRVNNANVLISKTLDDGITAVDLPDHIGPYYIAQIDSGVFQDYCSVERVTIPATVRGISAQAFAGCHNLKYVLFENPENLTIANGAFQTQKVGRHSCGGDISDTPSLTFVGPVSEVSEPFRYAMDEANKINVGTQAPTYITYFSGWPTGLVVQRNPDTGKNELRDYPTLTDLSAPDDSELIKIYGEIYGGPETDSLTSDYKTAMQNAYRDMVTGGGQTPDTDYEREIWDSVMNIVLPAGIDGIETGLFMKKEGAEDGDQKTGVDYFGKPGSAYKTLTAYGLKEVAGDDDLEDDKDTGCFANCDTFSQISLYGDTEVIGDYAFKGCDNLESVTVPNTVSELGKVPFTGCPKLTHVDFQGSEYYTCDNSIIYQLDTSGNKYKLVEFLEGRTSGSIPPTEVEGIKEIAEEAFYNTKVSFVDLSSSMVGTIPSRAFAKCEKLIQVILPNSVRSVDSQAFTECPNLLRLTVPNIDTRFREDALDTDGLNRPNDLVFVCNEDSIAAEYARTYDWEVDPNGMDISYRVEWRDWDGTELKVEYVIQGMDGNPPEPLPSREGYDFIGWSEEYRGVTENLIIYAMYETEDPEAKKVDVVFYDDDQETVLCTRRVTIGQVVELPADPVKEGYVFIGWIGDVTAPITQPTNFYAKWEAVDGRCVVRFLNDDGTVLNQQLVNPGEAAYEPKTPEPALAEHAGYSFAGWVPSDFTSITKDTDIYATYSNGGDGAGGSGSGSGSGSGGSGSDVSGGDGAGGSGSGASKKFYTLTVQNGSGSGSYVAGSQPVIVANDPADGQEFSNWTIEPADTKIASTALSATVVTMPEGNVTVTAHYKKKAGSGSSTVSGNNSNRPNSNSGKLSSGTTVVIDKNGLSNTGVVSATVKGSSDNFTIKVTESSAASEAVTNALKAEYGDISNIKYFPMDISLYDSTGTKKITDTTGLSVSITLPLPDSLITYAGNNKVAGVVNNRLDKLSAKFTTIDKVACVTFTAEHFSPYVIYVETDNLLESTIVDSTPKTGDGIHPKWFLSIGLACVAVVLFMKKDKRSLQTVKAA